MATSISFYHPYIILDACCVINLYATGYIEEILSSLPPEVAVAAYVHEEETLSIFAGPEEDVEQSKEQIDLQPLIERGLITVVSVESEDEEIAFVNLSVELDDGEAATGAIAINRNWAIATDDGKAIRILTRDARYIQLVSTLVLIRYWADTTAPPFHIVQELLKRVRLRARYRPGRGHLLYDWWLRHQ